MLDSAQQALLERLLETLSPDQRLWLSGYLSGSAESGSAVISPAATPPLQIYFATETGNAKRIAQETAKAAKARGFRPQVSPITKADLNSLAKEEHHVVFISATHGEGDPPDAARKFFELLKAEKDISLSTLKYAVLGLGDRAYAQFCKAASDLDEHFTRLGASRFAETQLLDVDFDDHIPAWLESLFTGLPLPSSAATISIPTAKPRSSKGYTRLSPVKGVIKDIVNLNDIDSAKETYHIEIAFEGDIAYQPGDAAGIILPKQADGSVPVPRLYSIASSQLQHEKEVHLTVALAWHFFPDGSKGFGVGSHYLANLKAGDAVEFYIHRNDMFRLPVHDDTPIIMVGPGTGIAPFRGFLQERDARGAGGETWLFFGDQRSHCDFLYQAEWQDYLATGVLSRIDLAFSRDQQEKIYVQHLMQARAKDIVTWMENGAHLYLCGSKSPMSEDVELTLTHILAEENHITAAEASHILEQWAEDNRYVKDVY